MTREHFKAIADGLKAVRPDKDTLQHYTWANCVIEMAGVCRKFNSRFDYAAFVTACGYPEGR